MSLLNQTHEPELTSWVATANQVDCDFPIQNLPFAVFRRKGSEETFRGGVAIGDQVVDLAKVAESEFFDGDAATAVKAASAEELNELMGLGTKYWSALRLALSKALQSGSTMQAKMETCLVAMSDVEYRVPARIGDYTDFYTSIYHAKNIGKLFRPDNPLLPNYQWIPIGYHGRSSSIAISGTEFPRPIGQTKAPDADQPSFGPCKRMDYELEVGIFIGPGNELGNRVNIDDAEDHVFGLCLLNDWSARDIQAWEYQPLGPFLSKNFASTVSPWIVTLEALAPYRTGWSRPQDHPQPLPYLDGDKNSSQGGFDIQLELLLESKQMRDNQQQPTRVTLTNFDYSYWTVAQMLAHHTVNGCNLQPGDFFGSGTMSGPNPGSEAALIESTKGGKEPLQLDNGESRTFLEDGDKVIIRGYCQKEGAARVGFGEVNSTILPAKAN